MTATFLSRIAGGLGATTLSQALVFASGVIIVPLSLHFWGVRTYGEWLTISALVGYLSLADLGMQSYVINRVCQEYMRGELTNVHRDLHSALKLSGVIVVVVFAGSCLAVWVGLPTRLFDGVDGGATDAVGALIILAGHTLLAGSQALIGGMYRATGLYARGAMLGNGFRAMQLVVTIVVLCLRGSMTALAAAWFVVNAISGAVLVWDLRRRRPEIAIGLRHGTLRHGLRLVGPSSMFGMANVASVLNVQGTVLAVGAMLGTLAVAQFSTVRALANLLTQAANVLTAAIWPEVTRLDAQQRREELRVLVRSYVKLTFSVAVLGALVLRAVGPDLYLVWTGRQLPFDSMLLNVFLVQSALACFWSSSALPLLASNRHFGYAMWSMANGVMTITLALILARPFGALGVAVGSLTADLVCGVFVVPLLTCRVIGEKPAFYYSATLLPGVFIALGVVLIVEVVRPVFDDPMGRLLWLPGLILAIYATASYVGWLDGEERRLMRRCGRRLYGFVVR